MTGIYPGRTTRRETPVHVQTVLVDDWRWLERMRVQALKAQGKQPHYASWTCSHGEHEPTDKRGPLRASQSQWKKHQLFVLRDRLA